MHTQTHNTHIYTHTHTHARTHTHTHAHTHTHTMSTGRAREELRHASSDAGDCLGEEVKTAYQKRERTLAHAHGTVADTCSFMNMYPRQVLYFVFVCVFDAHAHAHAHAHTRTHAHTTLTHTHTHTHTRTFLQTHILTLCIHAHIYRISVVYDLRHDSFIRGT